MSSIILALVALCLTLFLVVRRYLKATFGRPVGPLPPGPDPKPLIGNLADLPQANSPFVYQEWSKKYQSDLLFASALGNHIVVVNKYEDADELMERRSRAYSDRPEFPSADLMGMDFNVSLMHYGDVWRKHRRLYQEYFRPEAVRAQAQIQYNKAHDMLRGLLSSPEDFMSHCKMYSVSVFMAITYGYDVKSFDDPCIKVTEEAMSLGGSMLLPAGSIVNLFPSLKRLPRWFPGTTFYKKTKQVHDLVDEMKRLPVEFVKNNLRKGTLKPSIVSNFLEKKHTVGSTNEEEEIVTNIAYTTYGAASGTTSSATITFMYLMMAHPDIQQRAQAEIDSVTGGQRLPTFEDRKSLPFIEAIYREVLRWSPPFYIGAPRLALEDDYYKGYLIPNGAVIVPNIWAMTRDETLYNDPDRFNPDRFMKEDGTINDDDKILAYGFGRRSCVGKHAASAMLWLIMASILSTFNVRKAKNEKGEEVDVSDEFIEYGIIFQKAPFPCSILPRSEGARRLVEEAEG